MANASAAKMWAAYCRATGTPLAREHDIDAFGDSPELADELVDLVARGVKRATAGLVADYEHEGAPIGAPGDLWVVLDGSREARGIIRITETAIAPFHTVDARFARDEGEGDGSLEYWRAAHERFFGRRCAALGIDWHEERAIVFQRFELVWPPSE